MKKRKNQDPKNPPMIVMYPSVESCSLNTCIPAKVRMDRAREETMEYVVGRPGN